MAETGGTTTQSGINYQNSIASLYLGRLLDPRQRPATERVIEVRVEAPEHVDDIVVRHADGRRSFIQAKESLSTASEEWKNLWKHFAEQAKEGAGEPIRLILAIGTLSADMGHLREICDRAKGKQNHEEWKDSLTNTLNGLTQKIIGALPGATEKTVFELLSFVEVWIWPLHILERDMVPLWIPPASFTPSTLFELLRGKVGGKARIRGVFHAAQLLEELAAKNDVKINNALGWGVDAYLRAIRAEMGTLSVPGTNLRGPIEDLFFWLPLRDRSNDNVHLDFEDEDPRWRWERTTEIIDLRNFPGGKINRAVIDAGAGFGKTTMLRAIAFALSSAVRIPALISLDALAASNLTVLGYLNCNINSLYDVSIDWERLCEGGLAVILFDGLDELSTIDRTSVLNTIIKFASRFDKSPFLLTVRDSAALAVPLGVPILAVNRLDDYAIRQIAETYASHGSSLSPDVLSNHLLRHPDLKHLLRIPLFLALVLASIRPENNLPRSRSELLEHYLSLLFSPERYKAVAVPLRLLGDLREVAELLAWRGLENDGIGIGELEAKRLLRGQDITGQPDEYIERLVQIGLLRRAAARLQFTYPIVQEYLAACWMSTNTPKEIGPRFASITLRPWAQALQFALEVHSDAGTIISNQLKIPDDAFDTKLRLIARCIVNGAKVSPDVKKLVGERLASKWPSESYSIRSSIGYLLADGFLEILPEKAVEHISTWALHNGGAEIVAAVKSRALTRQVLTKYVNGDLTYRSHLHGWQVAVDDIADEAVDLYLNRVREQHTTDKELDSLSSLLAKLQSSQLHPNRWHEIAEDLTLPPIIRLAGYILGPRPISLTAWDVIDEIITDNERDTNTYLVYNYFWVMDHAEDKLVQMLKDQATPEERIRSCLEGILRSATDNNSKRQALRKVLDNSTPSQSVRFLILLCLAVWGDDEAELETVPMLLDQNFGNVTAWLYQSNKFSESNVNEAARILSERQIDSDSLFMLISAADFGLSYKTDILGFDGAAGNEPYIHPSRTKMRESLLSSLGHYNHSIGTLNIILQTGDTFVRDKLITEITKFISSLDGFMPFADDTKVSHSINLLGQQGSPLQLDFLFQILDKSSSNAGRQAVDFIVRSGDHKVIPHLLDRYNSRDREDFVREAIFSGLETLGGRYGTRFVREGAKLMIQ